MNDNKVGKPVIAKELYLTKTERKYMKMVSQSVTEWLIQWQIVRVAIRNQKHDDFVSRRQPEI